jgi:hypothetical protein
MPFQPPPRPTSAAGLTHPTPPLTPQHVASASASTAASFPAPPTALDVPMIDAEGFKAPLPPAASVKREAERGGDEEETGESKKRRIAPTLVGKGGAAPAPS